MFRKRVAVATIVTVAALVACGSPTPENDTASTQPISVGGPVLDPNAECYANVTTSFWVDEEHANETIDTALVWYRTTLTEPAGSGPTANQPYVAFAGVMPHAANTTPTEAVALAWVPEDEAGNFTLFNPICSAGSGNGVGSPEPNACLGTNLPVAKECLASAPSSEPTSGRECIRVTSAACLTVGQVKAFAGDNSCTSYDDTFCNLPLSVCLTADRATTEPVPETNVSGTGS